LYSGSWVKIGDETEGERSNRDLSACGETKKYVIPNPVRFLNGVRNLLFLWFPCEQQIPHPQTTRVRDDKSDFFRSLLCCFGGLRPNLRAPLFRRLHNRRSASSRENALLCAYDFALSGMPRDFCSRSCFPDGRVFRPKTICLQAKTHPSRKTPKSCVEDSGRHSTAAWRSRLQTLRSVRNSGQ